MKALLRPMVARWIRIGALRAGGSSSSLALLIESTGRQGPATYLLTIERVAEHAAHFSALIVIPRYDRRFAAVAFDSLAGSKTSATVLEAASRSA